MPKDTVNEYCHRVNSAWHSLQVTLHTWALQRLHNNVLQGARIICTALQMEEGGGLSTPPATCYRDECRVVQASDKSLLSENNLISSNFA